MKTIFAAILPSALLAAAVAGAAQAESWDMPVAYPADNYQTKNDIAFAEDVKTCSGGALEITVHPAGSLFKGDEIKRAVQMGDAQIGERLLSAHANENPIFAYDSIPFLASSFEASDRLRDAAAPVLGKLLESQGMMLLYSVPWPAQGMYFNKEVNSVADMAGVKFRAYNATTAKVAELSGMIPTQIEAAELKQALATGVVAAMISSGATGVDEKVWEDVSHFYDVKAWLPRNTVFVNAAAFAALPAEVQDCLKSSAATAQTRGTAEAANLAQGFVDTLAKNGMTVSAGSKQLSADMSEIGNKMTADWLAMTGADGAAIIDTYKSN
ncbi:TRAP transporter substrate-binding protein [Haematobacter missouriensis]|uniref:C4-dicarboxylate ABC transporter substrate-binding protein n=1 Tax=Haematobacter missouriensis TaxID=366616 RepID=A0A225D003_9RHOB|nr:TRAP transporter substrate-binding protein [Haematobacter missouriensis]OWJ77393.1 C4-dicarboxylate ABC transporter substrate-binding protein [Haematobacter missouriensis]OWJ83212.1 C4-dicarboxylate ABC transporter substrate-binding protein [Haematobacter missouriensis]